VKVIAFDCETHPIRPLQIAPPMVCISFAARRPDGSMGSFVLARCEPNTEATVRAMLADEDTMIVGLETNFDLGVVARAFPSLVPLIWSALAAGRITDVKIREALLNLSSHGSTEYVRAPDGSTSKVGYSMQELAARRLGLDLTLEKEAGSWRTNFHLLDGKPAREYPADAYAYSASDAIHTLELYESQEADVRSANGIGSLSTARWNTKVKYALFESTCDGIPVDHQKAAEVRALLERELAPEKMQKLIASGILRPAEPPRPQLRQWKKVAEILSLPPDWEKGRPPVGTDWAPFRAALEQGGVKFTGGGDESIDTKLLQARVMLISEQIGKRLKHTPSSTPEKPRISTDSEVIEDLAPHDEVLAEYEHRQSYQKLVTGELECLTFEDKPVERVHPNFNVLVDTGRTSSSAGRRPGLYPARNIQNPHELARPIFVPDPGHVMFSCDYSTLELVTLAQTTYGIFGQSRMRDLINDGVDLHAYLGAQLALKLHQQFGDAARAKGYDADPLVLYRQFLAMKSSPHEDARTFFKHWRKFAKPTNLGYPGGLGPVKFVTYAKKTYGVVCTVEQARELREIFRATYPEVPAFHEWITENCKDVNHETTWDDEEERWVQPYAYTSRLGMHRSNATFCAAANGLGMQTPGAEGGKEAYSIVQRLCKDPSQNSVLRQPAAAMLFAFIHDELLGQVSADVDLGNAQLREVERVMTETMQRYAPDVKIKAEPKLMLRWYKEAEQVFDPQGKLIPWTPKPAVLSSTPASTPPLAAHHAA
jgi:hypothetical protein